VNKQEIDCIAITNHNLFDLDQFKIITQELKIAVLPGIEINLEKGHLLLISDNTELTDFESKCCQIQSKIVTKEDSISVETLSSIFPDLSRYLLIPHYDKKPSISSETIKKLEPNIFAGEVTSARKFKACIKDASKLTPVIFSDVRIIDNLQSFPTRQTFIDLSEISFRGIKSCLTDKSKVSLTKSDGNDFFQVTDDGLYLSTGLNIILGERSTGKTYTLNRILDSSEDVKYIKQFSLHQNDEEKFKNLLSKRHSTVNENFLKEFKEVVYDVRNIDLKRDVLEVERYLTSLLKFASESEKLDSYSKATLFSEVLFSEVDLKNLEKLIEATTILIDNTEYRELINKHLEIESLKSLIIALILKHIELNESNLQKRWLNDVITKIKGELRLKTATSPPIDIDFYNILIENEKIIRFNEVVYELQKEREIDRKEIRGFKIVARTKKYTGAQQMKNKKWEATNIFYCIQQLQ